MRASHAVSIGLIVAVAVLAGVLSQRFAVSADWTYANRNTLTAASRRVLAALDQAPIRFTAYIYPGPQRQTIRTRLGRYTRAADNVTLTFADPARHPTQVRALNIGDTGAVRIRYRGRSQIVTEYDEPAITHALQRLSSAHAQRVLFVTGHGERSPADNSPSGYSQLAGALDAQGLQTGVLRLAATAGVPADTGLLVIASPQKKMLPGEISLIRDYVRQGGALLWADDPGARYGLQPLAADLGIRWRRGTLVYPDYKKLGTGHPAIALVSQYPDTPITHDLTRLSLFAFAGGLARLDASDWHHQVFLRSNPRSWLETGPLDRSRVTFQPEAGDRAGPVALGIALARPRPAESSEPNKTPHPQRAVAIADSDFMTNARLDTLGNRALGLAIFQWLARRDAQIAVDIPKARDTSLQLAPRRIRLLGWLFVVVLPLALLALGLGRWWLRRRR